MKRNERPTIFHLSHTFSKGCCEDAFSIVQTKRQTMLCVADGCGGLGSRRYEKYGGHTGAYIASRVVSKAVIRWARERIFLPKRMDDEAQKASKLRRRIHHALTTFARKHPWVMEPSRIKGQLQQSLPTTICVAQLQRMNDTCLEGCFLWAGDSRGYTLDASGLHQYTKDDVRDDLDAFDSLYQNTVLTNLCSLDHKVQLHLRKVAIQQPSIVFVATDGVFSCFETPMSFEYMLLKTMKESKSEAKWKLCLQETISHIVQDDATLVLMMFGFESYQAMAKHYDERYKQLLSEFIEPVQKHYQDYAYAKQKWAQYQVEYDKTKGEETCVQ